MNDLPYLMPVLSVHAFLWGAIWGSFLNVLVWRFPQGMSLSRPASHCPACQTPIRWHDNVPILGWLWLRGRCRDCGVAIAPRYPLVEAATAGLGLALWLHVCADERVATVPVQVLGMQFLLHFFFVFMLLAIALIDWDRTEIHDGLTVPLMGWGLVTALLLPKEGVWVGYHPGPDIVDAGIGLVLGGGLVMLVYWGYLVLTGRHGLGTGDATLLAAIGANLGWMSLPVVLFLASAQGLVAAGVFALIEKVRPGTSILLRGADREAFWTSEGGEPPSLPDGEEDPGFLKLALPFGPFLALAAVEYLFFGGPVMQWLGGGAWP